MEKALEIGKLDKRIIFQKYDESGTDAMGQTKMVWVNFKRVWANFRPVRGYETDEAARKFREEKTYKATVRYRPGITSDMRILFKGRQFEIKSIVNVNEANYKLEIECTEYIDKEVEE